MDQYPARAPASYEQPQDYEQPLEYGQPPMYDQPSGHGHPGQPNAVRTQGNLSYVSPNTVIVTSGVRPPNAMVLAILACICCFWPTGVCAIMYANQNLMWSGYLIYRIPKAIKKDS